MRFWQKRGPLLRNITDAITPFIVFISMRVNLDIFSKKSLLALKGVNRWSFIEYFDRI